MPDYDYVCDIEAEKAVLAACLLSEEAAKTIAAALEPEDFYRTAHAIIFDAIESILSEGRPVDAVVLAHRLDARGKLENPVSRSYLLGLCSSTFSLVAWPEHLRIVRECSAQRRILKAALVVVAESSRIQENFDEYVAASKARLLDAFPPEQALVAIDG